MAQGLKVRFEVLGRGGLIGVAEVLDWIGLVGLWLGSLEGVSMLWKMVQDGVVV
jgi:hypothetical protein